MNLQFLYNLGRLEPFEIKNSSFILILGAPSTFIYLQVMKYYHPDVYLPFYGNIIFAVLFFVIGGLPYVLKTSMTLYYGWLVFIATMLFQHYLAFSTGLNNFSLDFLLVTYVFIFGSLLLLSNRVLVLLYSISVLLHLSYHLYVNELNYITESAVLLSLITIFIFSFLIINGAVKYRKKLQNINISLEDTVKQRTHDIENRAKELLRKNKDLEEFAYVVSHDLKRPLRNMYTLTDWLSDDDENGFSKEAHTRLQLIKEQILQMDFLVEGILNYSLQIDSQKDIKEVAMTPLLKRMISLHESEHVHISLYGTFPKVHFNETQLTIIFQHIIQNAIKHSDKELVKITINYKLLGANHQFMIADNGPGIAPQYHGKVFELFQQLQTTSNVPSVGIGLALVKKILERNGGDIQVQSAQGKGATFIITLPVKP